MRRLVIAVAGLAWLAGCAQEPPEPVFTGPMPGETFADPEDPVVKPCLTVASLYGNTPNVFATGIVSGPDGSIVSITADGARQECRVDANGRVTALVPLSGR